MTTIYHGSYENEAPVIGVGIAARVSGENVFDGLFGSDSERSASSHGDYVFAYEVESIADSSDLNARIDDVIAFLSNEVNATEEEIEELANAIADDECTDSFEAILSPRLDDDIGGAYGWELQRLRGRVAAHLGFDAVEMDDEHGISYLIVNPAIIGVAV